MNKFIGIGRWTRNLELRYTQGGTAVANGTIAIDRSMSREKKAEAEASGEPTADFIDVVIWGKQAEHVCNYTGKGSQIAIEGRVQTGSYDDREGVRRKTVEVNAYSVKFLDSKGDNQGQGSEIEGFQPVDNDDLPF